MISLIRAATVWAIAVRAWAAGWTEGSAAATDIVPPRRPAVAEPLPKMFRPGTFHDGLGTRAGDGTGSRIKR